MLIVPIPKTWGGLQVFISCDLGKSTSSYELIWNCHSPSDDVLRANVTFEYLSDCFKHSLSGSKKSMNLEKLLFNVCTYVFLELNCSIDIRVLKSEIRRQISHIVQSARAHAGERSTIAVLRSTQCFSLSFKSVI